MTDPNKTFVQSALNPFAPEQGPAATLQQALIFKALEQDTEDELARIARQNFNSKVEQGNAEYRKTYPTSNTVLKVKVPPERLFTTLGPVLSEHWKNEVSIEQAITENLRARNAKITEDNRPAPYTPPPKMNGLYVIRYVDGVATETIKVEGTKTKTSFWSKVKQFFSGIFKRGQL